jgi:hypothetical protein
LGGGHLATRGWAVLPDAQGQHGSDTLSWDG